nr:MAG TPA: hypothetical protein [Crassvirales sp.]
MKKNARLCNSPYGGATIVGHNYIIKRLNLLFLLANLNYTYYHNNYIRNSQKLKIRFKNNLSNSLKYK